MKKLLSLLLLFSAPAFALVAPEKYSIDSTCPKNAPFSGRAGKCISCDTPKALMLENPKDCSLCPNRTVDAVDTVGGLITTNYCRLKKCPLDKPFYEQKWNWSGCKSCDDQPTLITKGECEQCPNMRWVVGSNFCAPNLSDRVYHGGSWDIIMNGEKMMKELSGGMVPFSTKCTELTPHYGIGVSAEECSHCPNSYMKDGFCFAQLNCAREPKWITKEECAKCPNMRWVEETESEFHSFCVPNVPGRIYVRGDGRFIECAEVGSWFEVKISAEECARCPNTYMKDGYCYGKE